MIETILTGFIIFMSVINIFIAFYNSKQKAKLKQMSLRDYLTGCKNRFALRDDLEKFYSKKEKIGIVLSDLNGLKKINDQFGHEEGDIFLRKSSGILMDFFGADQVYRLGGDEFLAVVVDVDNSEFDERIKCIKEKCFSNKVSFSFGTSFSEGYGLNYDRMFKEADERMYKEKAEYYKKSCKS